MHAVKTSAPDPLELVRQFESLAPARGFRVEQFGEADGCPLIALTRRTPGKLPRVYVSSGTHGDEPAPPQALLRLLDEGVFDSRAVWFLVPMVNPSGYRLGTRENADGIDLNRDYLHPRSTEVTAHIRWLERQPNLDAAFCLHEDWETEGFYLYEQNPTGRPSLADAMISAVAEFGPIERTATIDGWPSDAPGIIRPTHASLELEAWPEALYLREHHSTLLYTLETPSSVPLDQRLGMLNAAVRRGLDCLLGHCRSPGGPATRPSARSRDQPGR